MTEQSALRPSRRQALKFLAAPMLPLGGTAFLTACAVGAKPMAGGGAAFSAASFSSMAAPTLANPAAMASVTVGGAMNLAMAGGKTEEYKLAYHPFFVTGDMVSDGTGGKTLAGGYYDILNRPIMDASMPGKVRHVFSDAPDGSSLLTLKNAKVAGVEGNTVFAVVQFEYLSKNLAGQDTYGTLPSPIAVLTLDQDKATGELSLVKYHNVDTSEVNGLWITCGASLSPWGTHLSSEEYEPDAFAAAGSKPDKQFRAYSKRLFGNELIARHYDYGHMPEVTVNPDGSGSIVKHYNMGRISHEMVHIAPDERTALMGDDAPNGGAFLFIADKPKKLDAGTLYVGKWNQTSGKGTGSGTFTWIKLGHATSAEIRKLVEGGIQPADIMDVKTADPGDASYTKVPHWGIFNWIKVKPGMEKAAAFLETHRYAALMGGSLGFTKWEGTTLNAKDKVAYIAISRIETGMLNGSGGVKVEGPYSGAVYTQNLKGGQIDTTGAAIDSEWVPVDMAAVPALVSEDIGGGKQKGQDALGNFAVADKIATPDNLKFSEAMRTLFIGEDSNTHVNNFLWAYNVDTKQLSRILTCPAGAESTGLHAVDEINGWTYIMSNFQHAGDWEKGLHDKVKGPLQKYIDANYKNGFGAAVGYLTADGMQPAMGKVKA
ncbi:MAG: alkaline phosphatase PhoX [Variovorax sp.]